MARNGSRPARATALPALLAALALVAGCGAGSGGGLATVPGNGGGVTSTSPAPSAGAELTIVYQDGTGATTTWTLACDPPGGTHPHPEAACAALAARGAIALPPVDPRMMCTQIYGGPQQATITGSWRGERVKSVLRRTNGCEIARWKNLTGLLPEVGVTQ